MKPISQELIQQFHEDGAVVLRGVFSPKWVHLIQRAIKRNMQHPSKYGEWLQVGKDSGFYFNDYCNWKSIIEFREYVEQSPAAEIAGLLMDSKWVKFYHEHVLVKECGSEKPTPWHHDQSYYPIDGEKVCSIWMPVDPVPMNSSLRLVRGSHKWGWFKPRKFATELDYVFVSNSTSAQMFKSVPVEEIDSGKHDILQWEMEPGDCVVFHMKTLHGAEGNTSTTQQRRVLATRWLGDDACLSERPWEVSPPMKAVFSGQPSIRQLPTLWRAA